MRPPVVLSSSRFLAELEELSLSLVAGMSRCWGAVVDRPDTVPAFRVQSLLRQSTEGAGIVELGVGWHEALFIGPATILPKFA